MRLRKITSNRGAALVGALLLLFMASALAVGVMYLVMSEKKISGSDVENNSAYYAAEAGMEKMMSDLANLYTIRQAPTVAEITNLSNFQPVLPGVTYSEYAYAFPLGTPGGAPSSQVSNISSGPNAGLIAQIVPLSLQVTAQRPGTAQVRMTRNVEVALIPVFQFGVFSDSDLSYFAGPPFDFAGRVHTNGNLFLASSNSLTFHDKVTAVGEVIRAELANGVSTVTTGRTDPVNIPTAPLGCDGAKPACRDLKVTEGSKVGGLASADNPNWANISINDTHYYNGMILNGLTGAHRLDLPFVTSGVGPIEIIRRPPAGEDPAGAVGQSREYNKAQIRVLLTDTADELPGGAADSQNIQLDNVGVYASGVPVPGANPTYFATGNKAKDSDFVPSGTWPLINGFLRVEIRKTDGTYIPVTHEWLELGFARGLLPPNSEAGLTNTVHPNAILIFQMQADRNGDGDLKDPGEWEKDTPAGSATQYYWFPINMYDAREGEVRDKDLGATNKTCAVGGVMNLVELDVNNLKRWLAGTIVGSGSLTEYASQNGYILYFSDRRGELPDPVTGLKIGEYGWDDIVNAAIPAGTPNGVADAGEAVNASGGVNTYGGANVATGFGLTGNPTVRISTCTATGRKNRVTGARHALRLENGSQGNIPTKPDGTGGFTVVSEQPVYLLGDYNANSSSGTTWTGAHASTAVIADAVTLLSNNWNDYNGFNYPTTMTKRVASQTWYRVAIAAGKNRTFPRPTWGAAEDFGTDGGIHNFLRFLEYWTNPGPPSTPISANYKGSLVSFYYSDYGNSIFKCCAAVYGAPDRKYSFDTDFQDPSKMPPGTPRFQDIVNVGYQQDFRPQ